METIRELSELVMHEQGVAGTDELVVLVETDRSKDPGPMGLPAVINHFPLLYAPEGGEQLQMDARIIELLALTADNRERGMDLIQLAETQRLMQRLVQDYDPEVICRLLQTKLNLTFLINATRGIKAEKPLKAMQFARENGGTTNAYVTVDAHDEAAKIFDAAQTRSVLPQTLISRTIVSLPADEQFAIPGVVDLSKRITLTRTPDWKKVLDDSTGQELHMQGTANLFSTAFQMHDDVAVNTGTFIPLHDICNPFGRHFVFSDIQMAVRMKYGVRVSFVYIEGTNVVRLRSVPKEMIGMDARDKINMMNDIEEKLRDRYIDCELVRE